MKGKNPVYTKITSWKTPQRDLTRNTSLNVQHKKGVVVKEVALKVPMWFVEKRAGCLVFDSLELTSPEGQLCPEAHTRVIILTSPSNKKIFVLS